MITAFQPNAFQTNGFQIQSQINAVLLCVEEPDVVAIAGRVLQPQYRFASATLRAAARLRVVEQGDTAQASGRVQLATHVRIIEPSDHARLQGKTHLSTRMCLLETGDGFIMGVNCIVSCGSKFTEPQDTIRFALRYTKRNRLREEEELVKILLAA